MTFLVLNQTDEYGNASNTSSQNSKVKGLKIQKPTSRNESYLQVEEVFGLALFYYLINNDWSIQKRGKRKTELQLKNPIISWDVIYLKIHKILMLGKIEGEKRMGRQRMGWLDGITEHVPVLNLFSHVWLSATLRTIASQPSLYMGFSRQECWSRFPFPSPEWTWVWANSGREWRTGKPDVLQSMGLQSIRHVLATK